jgi:hypothetical protein
MSRLNSAIEKSCLCTDNLCEACNELKRIVAGYAGFWHAHFPTGAPPLVRFDGKGGVVEVIEVDEDGNEVNDRG